MKNFLSFLVLIIIIIAGVYFFNQSKLPKPEAVNPNPNTEEQVATTTVEDTTPKEEGAEIVIGKSVEGREIKAYNFGTGDTRILLIGGIHGGYSWNTSSVMFEALDYFKANPSAIPSNIKITIIPVLNPDGLYNATKKEGRFTKADVSTSEDVLVASRFNANKVDLSRNFDCDWKSVGVWQTRQVSGGKTVFSEPESVAIKQYVESHDVKAIVAWYSAAGGVYASECGEGILSETKKITETFAKASGYPAHETFDFYVTNGDMVNWFAMKKIPATSVLLTNHTDVEWDKNKKGIEALIKLYTK